MNGVHCDSDLETVAGECYFCLAPFSKLSTLEKHMKDIHDHDAKRPGRPYELTDKRDSLLSITHMYKEITHTLRDKYADKYPENTIISKKFVKETVKPIVWGPAREIIPSSRIYELIENAQRAGTQLACPYCEHTMAATKKNVGHLQNHLLSKHKIRVDDMKPLKGCEWCKKTFSESSSLRRHMKMTHGNGDPEVARFKCPVCPAPFTTEITMKE